MRIYLDQCLIQYLKTTAGANLYAQILADKEKNIYFFSEAHLYDLRHDRSEEKYADMALLETVAGKHCLWYDSDRVSFELFSPRAYYDRYDWEHYFNSSADQNPLAAITQAWKLIPLDLSALVPTANLPADMPEELRRLLSGTRTMYDFFSSFTGISRAMTADQKRFKALLQYLHQHDFLSPVYRDLGIEGFNGKQITDREKFFRTLADFCARIGKPTNAYGGFLSMYNALELLGFVKGKPRKQKLMNLINDGRHAFFAGYCDVIVSRDEDFLNKSSFMYAATGISPLVFDIPQFEQWLQDHAQIKGSAADIVHFLKNKTDDDLLEQRKTNDILYTSYQLPWPFFNYFNMFTIATDDTSAFFYLSAIHRRFSNGQFLTEEIDRLIILLTHQFGVDQQQKGKITEEEKTAEAFKGRAWYADTFIVELIVNNGLHLTFNQQPSE